MDHRRAATIVAFVFTSATYACADDPILPGGGQVVAALESPHGAEGAAVFEITNGTFEDPLAPGGKVFVHQNGSTSRAVVILDQPGQIVLLLTVDDVQNPPTIAVIEVAAGDNMLRSAVGEYRVDIEPVPAELRTVRAPQ